MDHYWAELRFNFWKNIKRGKRRNNRSKHKKRQKRPIFSDMQEVAEQGLAEHST